MTKISGKHILITGGASGIGRLMAEAMKAEQAAHIVLWDIDGEKLRETMDFLEGGNTRISGNEVDMGDLPGILRACQNLIPEVRHIDILINNAGIVTGRFFNEHDHEDIQRTIAINFNGAVHLTLELMKENILSDEGHIVNIDSASAFIGNPRMSLYAASKWAMMGWSESLRLEFKQQHSARKITLVCPSYINTGMFEGVSPPLFTPMLSPDRIVKKIIKGIKKDRSRILAPFMVKLLPFLKGVLPGQAFDFLAGNMFGVYHSMRTFKGR